MKNLLRIFLILAALYVLFSSTHLPFAAESCKGAGTRYKGDSGMVIPGNGKEPAEVSATEPPQEIEQANNTQQSTETSEEIKEQINKISKEEHNKMTDLICSFWHGVAAVLIGEASALTVVFAWSKIRGCK